MAERARLALKMVLISKRILMKKNLEMIHNDDIQWQPPSYKSFVWITSAEISTQRYGPFSWGREINSDSNAWLPWSKRCAYNCLWITLVCESIEKRSKKKKTKPFNPVSWLSGQRYYWIWPCVSFHGTESFHIDLTFDAN